MNNKKHAFIKINSINHVGVYINYVGIYINPDVVYKTPTESIDYIRTNEKYHFQL